MFKKGDKVQCSFSDTALNWWFSRGDILTIVKCRKIRGENIQRLWFKETKEKHKVDTDFYSNSFNLIKD